MARDPGLTYKQSRFFCSTDGQAELDFHSGCTHPFSSDDHCTLLADVGESVTES